MIFSLFTIALQGQLVHSLDLRCPSCFLGVLGEREDYSLIKQSFANHLRVHLKAEKGDELKMAVLQFFRVPVFEVPEQV